MNKKKLIEVFRRYEGNPILTPDQWPYPVHAVFNPGAVKFKDETLLLVRVEDNQGYSHLTLARSKDGKTNWQISSLPTLQPDRSFGEDVFGLEDPRITWIKEREEYIVTYVSFFANVAGEPPGISLISTKDFSKFERLGQQLMPPNKDAALFPKTIKGYYSLVHRPIVEGRADIWVSFSPDLQHWGKYRVLIPARHRSWDANRVGIGPPPIETPEGWLIIYHGVRVTASGSLYRLGLALLDLDTLKVIHRSRDWVLGPRETYERVGDVDGVIFPSGAVVDEKTNELLVYYGACDSVLGLAIANLEDIISYLKACPEV